MSFVKTEVPMTVHCTFMCVHCEKESTEVRLFCFLIQLVGIQMPDNCISIKGAYTLVLKYYLIALQYQQMVFKTIPRLRYEIVVP